ncbi:MAG: polysaccharide biosynthesis protein, partial [Anaerolineae bacterium]|nr:polysaccharide biosynthesis protein [Anaerolineae bacterium]
VACYVLRLELGPAFEFYMPSALWMILITLAIKPLVYYYFGLYRRLWAYASIQELRLIVASVTTASLLVSTVMITLFMGKAFVGFPRSVLVIDWLLSLLLVGGLRFSIRLIAENQSILVPLSSSRLKQVLIVGAGDAGAMVVRELQRNPQLHQLPVGFLDDDNSKLRQQIYGIPVVGTLNDLSTVLDREQVDEVVIAIPSAPGKVVRLVADVCRLKGVPFKTMPGIYELLGGEVNVSRLRDVEITDLLRRDPARVKEERISETITGKVVLVTGAGGSIGQELCRQIARMEPAELVMLGHGENSIFEAILDLRESYSSLRVSPVIADIRDKDRMQQVFETYHPQVVFHTAAHKHVPLMEMRINVFEAITNNIMGTRNVVDVALKNDVERLVMISTDKAIRPVNVYGATKRIAEMIVLNAGKTSQKAFCVVRFGNVLGSRGSVVPIFKHQIARGGPITITHPDMERYFMTIPEAVYLVLQSASMGQGGDVFVLNMGQQIKIVDLARDLIRLSGLDTREIEIVFTGIRPGEKLSEDLWDEGHQFKPTIHPDIFQHETHGDLYNHELNDAVDQLILLANEGKTEDIVHLLDEIIPCSSVSDAPIPEITAIT